MVKVFALFMKSPTRMVKYVGGVGYGGGVGIKGINTSMMSISDVGHQDMLFSVFGQ